MASTRTFDAWAQTLRWWLTGRPLEVPRSRGRFLTEAQALAIVSERQFRFYQADAAWKAMRLLIGANVLLTLPQGTGKTYVSQLAAYGLLRANPGSKVLVVVPAKELRHQYVDMARWMGEYLDPRLVVIPFDDTTATSAQSARMMARMADIIVATPQFFSNRMDNLGKDTTAAIRLCVLDEVDVWPVDDFLVDEHVRFHAAIKKLIAAFHTRATFLGLTASPLTSNGAQVLLGILKFKDLKPYHESIEAYLPRTQITPVPCDDPWIRREDALITQQSKSLFGRLGSMVRLPTGTADVWRFLAAVAAGRYGAQAAELARGILEAQHRRVQLFEDALGGGGRKLARAGQLAQRHRPAVVFCREVRTVANTAHGMTEQSITIAHSQIGDQYIDNIELFKRGSRDVLVMTRDLGKRGVDFPMAKSLIVFSPKTSVTAMDQELCRTRSTVKGGEKQVYILFYARTYEEEKLRAVLAQLVALRMYGKYPKFTLSTGWAKWLHERSPVTLRQLLTV